MTDSQGSSQTGIWVKLEFFPLAVFLFLCTPRVEIDGVVELRPWGTHFFPVAPGMHRVRIWFAYLTLPYAGLNQIDILVAPGQAVALDFNMPPWMFAKGSLHATQGPGGPAIATPTTAAGWHPDPSGRHELRYWDGSRWTEDVSDAGAQARESL